MTRARLVSQPDCELARPERVPDAVLSSLLLLGRDTLVRSAQPSIAQVLDSALGDHSFKVGFDASFIELYSLFHNNLDGTFTFTTTQPFDSNIESTYPTQFTQNVGDPIIVLNNNIYAVFVPDQWKLLDRLTINYGRAAHLQHRLHVG